MPKLDKADIEYCLSYCFNEGDTMETDEKVAVYTHYQSLAQNEDRLFAERLALSFTGHSILFLAFIETFNIQIPFLTTLRVALCAIGIILTYCGMILAKSANTAFKKWMCALQNIELKIKDDSAKSCPDRDDICLPHEARKCESDALEEYWDTQGDNVKLPWTIGCEIFPAMFFVLWGFSLVITIYKLF